MGYKGAGPAWDAEYGARMGTGCGRQGVLALLNLKKIFFEADMRRTMPGRWGHSGGKIWYG